MSKKPLILVVNDDSIYAPGIRSLIKVMNDFGDVVVVAPKNPQSGMSHAISLNNPLIYDKVIIDNGPQIEYSCNGTPSDCVKIAFNKILTRKPDLCVSGINHGSNSSINVIYSGTMAAWIIYLKVKTILYIQLALQHLIAVEVIQCHKMY